MIRRCGHVLGLAVARQKAGVEFADEAVAHRFVERRGREDRGDVQLIEAERCCAPTLQTPRA